MEERHFTSAVEILKKIHYITLATVCEDGSPWNSPVSAHFEKDFYFLWGSSPDNVHSQNIHRDGRAFVVIYDSTVPEGRGEGLYMTGTATELDNQNETIKKYRFIPSKVWINDEVKYGDGSYKHDIRIELDIEKLKQLLSA